MQLANKACSQGQSERCVPVTASPCIPSRSPHLGHNGVALDVAQVGNEAHLQGMTYMSAVAAGSGSWWTRLHTYAASIALLQDGLKIGDDGCWGGGLVSLRLRHHLHLHMLRSSGGWHSCLLHNPMCVATLAPACNTASSRLRAESLVFTTLYAGRSCGQFNPTKLHMKYSCKHLWGYTSRGRG
jgi:hypothetical protein